MMRLNNDACQKDELAEEFFGSVFCYEAYRKHYRESYREGLREGYEAGFHEGLISGALVCGKTPEEVAEMLGVSIEEVLEVREREAVLK